MEATVLHTRMRPSQACTATLPRSHAWPGRLDTDKHRRHPPNVQPDPGPKSPHLCLTPLLHARNEAAPPLNTLNPAPRSTLRPPASRRVDTMPHAGRLGDRQSKHRQQSACGFECFSVCVCLDVTRIRSCIWVCYCVGMHGCGCEYGYGCVYGCASRTKQAR